MATGEIQRKIMNTVDFNQAVYKLHVEEDGGMWIEKSTLAEVVRLSAEETTSPRGVEPKLHIEERNDGWELRMWEIGGRSSLVEWCETEEEAERRWLELTYEYDYLNDDLYYQFWDSVGEAIAGYLDVYDDDEPLTADDIKARIAQGDAEHAEKVERIKQEDIDTYRQGVEVYQKCGTVSKNLRRVCDKILLSPIRSSFGERIIEVHHDEQFREEVRQFRDTVINKSNR